MHDVSDTGVSRKASAAQIEHCRYFSYLRWLIFYVTYNRLITHHLLTSSVTSSLLASVIGRHDIVTKSRIVMESL